MMAHISVWINRTDRRDRYFEGYHQGDPLELALRLEAEGETIDLVEMVFVRLNEPPHRGLGTLTVEQIEHYHTRFPSLSVGDVVEIDGSWFQIAPVGHGPIDNPMWADLCEGCRERRIVWPRGRYLHCADCAQGDYEDEPKSAETEIGTSDGKFISLMRVNNKWVATLRMGGTVLDQRRGYPRRVKAAIDGWLANDNAELDFPLPDEFLEAVKLEVK